MNDRVPGFELEYKAISGKFVHNASNVGICDQMLTLLEILMMFYLALVKILLFSKIPHNKVDLNKRFRRAEKMAVLFHLKLNCSLTQYFPIANFTSESISENEIGL